MAAPVVPQQINLALAAIPAAAGGIGIGQINIGAGNPQDRVRSISRVIGGREFIFTIFRDINEQEDTEMTRAEFERDIQPIVDMLPNSGINLQTCGAIRYITGTQNVSYEPSPARQGHRGQPAPIPHPIQPAQQHALTDVTTRITATIAQVNLPNSTVRFVNHNQPQNQNIPVAQPNNPPALPPPERTLRGRHNQFNHLLQGGRHSCTTNAIRAVIKMLQGTLRTEDDMDTTLEEGIMQYQRMIPNYNRLNPPANNAPLPPDPFMSADFILGTPAIRPPQPARDPVAIANLIYPPAAAQSFNRAGNNGNDLRLFETIINADLQPYCPHNGDKVGAILTAQGKTVAITMTNTGNGGYRYQFYNSHGDDNINHNDPAYLDTFTNRDDFKAHLVAKLPDANQQGTDIRIVQLNPQVAAPINQPPAANNQPPAQHGHQAPNPINNVNPPVITGWNPWYWNWRNLRRP